MIIPLKFIEYFVLKSAMTAVIVILPDQLLLLEILIGLKSVNSEPVRNVFCFNLLSFIYLPTLEEAIHLEKMFNCKRSTSEHNKCELVCSGDHLKFIIRRIRNYDKAQLTGYFDSCARKLCDFNHNQNHTVI